MEDIDLAQDTMNVTSLNISISKQQKYFINQAATLRNLSLSEFVLKNAYEAATEVMAEKSRFVLTQEQWDDFCQALDSPPKSIPELKSLFAKPSPFNDPIV